MWWSLGKVLGDCSELETLTKPVRAELGGQTLPMGHTGWSWVCLHKHSEKSYSRDSINTGTNILLLVFTNHSWESIPKILYETTIKKTQRIHVNAIQNILFSLRLVFLKMKRVLVCKQDQKVINNNKKGRIRTTHLERNEIFYLERCHPAPKIHKLSIGIPVLFHNSKCLCETALQSEFFFVKIRWGNFLPNFQAYGPGRIRLLLT